MRKLYLGIDIGTQSVKVVAFDELGNVAASASENQYMQNIRPGWATEKPRVWWEKIVNCIQKIVAEVSAEAICGIGVDGVCHSPVPVDRDGRLLQEDVQLYCDKRCADIVERYLEDYKQQGVWEATRNVPAGNWMGIKIRWIKEHEPAVYEKAACIMSAKDYINLKLTGVMATDPSEASGTMLLDHRSGDWSRRAISYMGLDREKLPVIHKSAEVIGTVTKAAAELTGLKQGTPVVAGSGDMPSGLYGAGMVRDGGCVDLIGTGSVIAVFSREASSNDLVANLRCASPGWSPYLSMDSSGGAYRWLRDVICKHEARLAREKGESAFEYMNRLAREISPGSDGVMFFPYLQGERIRGSAYSKGSFVGMTPATGTGHFARAVMEGVAYESRASLELLDPSGNVEFVTLTGGASKGKLWSQIKADIYGKTVRTVKQKETTAFGSALLAAVADGAYRDEIEGAGAATQFEEEFIPNQENHKRYTEFYQIFTELHGLMQQPYKHLGKILDRTEG